MNHVCAAVALAVAAALLLAACGKEQGGPPPPPEVSVITLKPRADRDHRPAAGTHHGVPRRRSSSAGHGHRAEAPVRRRHGGEGRRAAVPDRLPAVIAPRCRRPRRRSSAPRRRPSPRKLLAERYEPLIAANAVSKQENDEAIAARARAEADVASARAAVDAARINVVYTQVLSPITGRIGRTLVTEGALVTSGQQSAAGHRAAARSHLRGHRAVVHRDAAPAAPARQRRTGQGRQQPGRSQPHARGRQRVSRARPPQGVRSVGGSEHRLGGAARGVPESAPRTAAGHVRARAARAGHALGGAAGAAARRLAQPERRSHGADRRPGRQGGGARGHRRSRHRGRVADHRRSHGRRSRHRRRPAEGEAGCRR